MMRKLNIFFTRLDDLLSYTLCLKGLRVSREEFSPYLLQLERVSKTRGLTGMIDFNKSVRTAVMNYLSGNPLRPKGVRCTTKGLPVCLGPLIKHIEGQDLDFIQVLTTVLFSTRALVTKARPDLTTITAPLKKGSVEMEVKYGTYF
jgi:hypothetical protein